MSIVRLAFAASLALSAASFGEPATAVASQPAEARHEPAAGLVGPDSPRSDADPDDEPTVLGDLSSPWFHIGGGGGLTVGIELDGFALDPVAPLGRFTVGAGFYTFLFYLGGAADLSFRAAAPFRVTGTATIGVAIPVPVLHPLIGLRVGGGTQLLGGAWYPHITAGPQVGFILRKFDGKPGLRAMLDLAGLYEPTRPAASFEVVLTVALVL